jgi:hypothetical protein
MRLFLLSTLSLLIALGATVGRASAQPAGLTKYNTRNPTVCASIKTSEVKAISAEAA